VHRIQQGDPGISLRLLAINDMGDTIAPLYPRPLVDADVRQIRVLTFNTNNAHHNDDIHLEMLEVPLDDDVVVYDALSYTWDNPTSELSRENPWITERVTPRPYTSQLIYVNKQELEVTANLFYALKRLRPRFQHGWPVRCLWVDAICINQADKKEKAEQVKIMGDIYKQAAEVLVWLGEEEGETDSDMAIDLLQNIYYCFIAFGEDNEEVESLLDRMTQEQEDLQLDRRMATTGVPTNEITGILAKLVRIQTLWVERVDLHRLDVRCDERAWASVARLMERSWFSRLWTYQEKALARSVTLLVGGKTMSWANCTTVMGLITNHDNTTGKTKVLPKGEARRFYESSQPSEATILGYGGAHQNLFEVVRTSSSRSCSDPRDKIYGVLSTMSKEDAGYMHILPLVDYEATSYEKLYTEFARFYLEDLEDLRILQCCSTYPGRSDGLPSWAPDWSKLQFGNMLPTRVYNAATQSEPIIGYRSEDKEMVVYGLVIDRIKDLAPMPHADLPAIKAMNEKQLLDMAKDYMKLYGCLYMASRDENFHQVLQDNWPFISLDWALAIRWEAPYVTGQTYAEAYWRTLIGDMDPYALAYAFSQRVPSDLSISNMAEIWLEQRPVPADYDPQQPDHRVRRAQFFYPVSARVQAMTLGKHFYLTHEGFMGFGTYNAEVGDIVVVFRGSQVPMLLRKREHEEHYTLVGETYGTYHDPFNTFQRGLLYTVVHGLMDGRAMDMVDGGESLTEFNIR